MKAISHEAQPNDSHSVHGEWVNSQDMQEFHSLSVSPSRVPLVMCSSVWLNGWRLNVERFEAVIFANAIFILYATDYEMQNLNQPTSLEDQNISAMAAIELLLVSFYVLELALKLIVHKFYFFWNSEMVWNWCLDCLANLSVLHSTCSVWIKHVFEWHV